MQSKNNKSKTTAVSTKKVDEQTTVQATTPVVAVENANKIVENKNAENNIKNNKNGNKTFYFPNQQDSLFWCYYIITNGDTKYEMLQHKNFLLAKQIKIELVGLLM